LLKGESKVFKLVGPVMVPHSKNEALEHVTKRLDFIETEMYVFAAVFVQTSNSHAS
jgi:chaperonin cofactor prefoldin